MGKTEIIARLRHGLRNVADKGIHAMVELEINRINSMKPSELEAYLDQYRNPVKLPQVEVRRTR